MTSLGALANDALAQQPPPPRGSAPAAPPPTAGPAATPPPAPPPGPPGAPPAGPPPGGGPWFQPQPGQPPPGQPPPGQGYAQPYPQHPYPQQPHPQPYPQQPYPQQQTQPWGPPGQAGPPPRGDGRDEDGNEDDRARRGPRKRQPPARLKWDEGDPIPPGYAPKSRPNLPLLITGAVLFGVTYLPSLGIAASVEEGDDELIPLAIPLAGPFITIATADAEGAGTFWLAVDGVVQVTGATLFISSFVAKSKFLRRVAGEPLADGAPSIAIGPSSVHVKGAF